jgi:3-oxoacyl-[acyl-carrier-protein] synthase III
MAPMCKIAGASYYVPESRRDLGKVASVHGISPSILQRSWGIESVPLAGCFENECRMAIRAVRKLELTSVKGLDAVIFCSNSARRGPFAARIAAAIGSRSVRYTKDIGSGCGGFIEGLNLANHIVKQDQSVESAIVCCGEVNRMKYKDCQALRFLHLGDGGGAVLLTRSTGGEDILSEGPEFQIQKQPTRQSAAAMLSAQSNHYLPLMEQLLHQHNLTKADLKCFLLTQSPAASFNNLVTSVLSVPPETVPFVFTQYGHLGTVDHPLMISQLQTRPTPRGWIALMALGEAAREYRFSSCLWHRC